MRRAIAVLLAASATVGITACGDDKPTSEADSEGIYFTVGKLKYQVQISRELNAASVEDREYLQGVSSQDAALPKGSTWFGVFVQVRNPTKQTLPTADETGFKIVDTQGDEYFPIPVRNQVSYAPARLGSENELPDINEIARFGPTQGRLLLFKIPYSSLENRPLEMHVDAPGALTPREGTVVLDV